MRPGVLRRLAPRDGPRALARTVHPKGAGLRSCGTPIAALPGAAIHPTAQLQGDTVARPIGRRLRALLAIGALAWAQAAHAHDSWFEERASTAPSELRLMLGTGHYPALESSVGLGAMVRHGCQRGAGEAVPLQIVREVREALQLRARLPGSGHATCWTQMVSFDTQIEPRLVQAYFKEINASPAIRQTWAEMLARGVRWTERYTKHARIELFDEAANAEAPAPAALPMGMDIVFEGLQAAPRAGETLAFRVLRDGAGLADQPVQLLTARSRVGFWVKTDSEGRAQVRVPLSGSWLLRAVDLRPIGNDRWDSRFVTLAFEVAAAAR